jgi:hypothetical protein
MLRFSQKYLAFVIAYWCTSVLVYFLCFGSIAVISASFLESAAALFSAPVVAAVTAMAALVFVAMRKRYDVQKFLPILIIALAQIPFFSAFHMIKVCIPQIIGFWSDQAFADIDRVLHGNQDAFVLYQSILGDMIPEKMMVTLYFPIWVAIAYMYPAIVAALERDEARAIRHIRLHMISWILLGTVLATLFSSVGPVYFALVTGQEDFGYINDFLRADRTAFAGVIGLQNKLWTEHLNGALGSGISAFPSLHVAAATLPVVWLVDRFGWRGLIGAVYPLLIQYGSVLTGFHYAIDGYASALIVALCFAFLKWREGAASSEPRQTPATQASDSP